MMIVIVLILLIVCLIGVLVYCCSAGKIPYYRQTDDDAQMEFLRRYEEG